MRAIGLLFVATLLAGCGLLLGEPGGDPGQGGGGGGVDQPPVKVAPDEPPPGNGGVGGGGGVGDGDGSFREQPDPDIVDARPVSVERYVIGPDGVTVVVYWWGGTPNCFGLKEVTVEVEDGVPAIGVLEGTRPDAVGMACTMEALLKSAVVTLPQPILVDGSGADHPAGEPMLAMAPMAVEPVAGVTDARAHAITGYSLPLDGVTLTIHYVGGTENCYGLAASDIERVESGALRVTISEGRLPGVAGACEDIGIAKAVTVMLDAPILVSASPS